MEALPLLRLDDRVPKLAVQFGLSISGMRPFDMVDLRDCGVLSWGVWFVSNQMCCSQ